MKVFLLKNVENLGLEGSLIEVADGYALNFLLPRKLALQVTPENEAAVMKKIKAKEKQEAVSVVKTSQLAQRIGALQLVLRKKIHEGSKLYGAVTPQEVVDLLADKGVSISKSQVEFEKAIKTSGAHRVIIRLSQKLKPEVTLKVVPE